MRIKSLKAVVVKIFANLCGSLRASAEQLLPIIAITQSFAKSRKGIVSFWVFWWLSFGFQEQAQRSEFQIVETRLPSGRFSN